MANKVEGEPCKNCGSTLRYQKSGRKFGPCVQCTLENNKSSVRYYEYRGRDQYNVKSRINTLVINARNRAKKQSLPFNISTDIMVSLWESQGGKCAVSGREFCLDYNEKGGPHQNGPSIDKIVPELGYTVENVRFVTYQVNTALSNFGDEALLLLLEDIKKFKETK